MKNFFACVTVSVLLCAFAFSQTGKPSPAAPAPAPTIDHVALHVRDLEKSAQFYQKVMGLSRIADPFHGGLHVWLRIGEHQQLHLFSGPASSATQEHDIRSHMAFRVASAADFRKRLETMKVPYQGIRNEPEHMSLRADGVTQIYFQDPDGYWIEVNDDRF